MCAGKSLESFENRLGILNTKEYWKSRAIARAGFLKVGIFVAPSGECRKLAGVNGLSPAAAE